MYFWQEKIRLCFHSFNRSIKIACILAIVSTAAYISNKGDAMVVQHSSTPPFPPSAPFYTHKRTNAMSPGPPPNGGGQFHRPSFESPLVTQHLHLNAVILFLLKLTTKINEVLSWVMFNGITNLTKGVCSCIVTRKTAPTHSSFDIYLWFKPKNQALCGMRYKGWNIGNCNSCQ